MSYAISTLQDQTSNLSDNPQVSDAQAKQDKTPSNPSNKEFTPNGYGLVHHNYIYGIYQDSDLGREYEKLETKEEKREFLLTKGEKRGEVVLDTRHQAPDKTQE
ncbi:hypothetical protein SLS60_006308 [Paraconiothyrium brasiliense]|uniref:Uncharacterized protein n=1 Tax=Paraconiothyrium brasiliense TaxID=300254 RepID=A0ABR3RAD3_9PLEO